MVQSPSLNPIRSLSSQEIPRNLWNPKFHYHVHNIPPPVSILNQINPVHSSSFHFLKIQFNIISTSMPVFSKCSPFLKSPHQDPMWNSPLPPYVLHAPPNLHKYINNYCNNILNLEFSDILK